MQAITQTNFQFKGQSDFYRGKVRDVYIFPDKLIVISSDRISAFDVILPQPIPFKGQVLNQLSAFFLTETASDVPNWLEANPDPNVSVGKRCKPVPLEMVIRGHLAGTAWRAYKAGQREFNGNILPEGLRENDALPQPIITPSTKAEQGQHDEDISTIEILNRGLVTPSIYEQLEYYTKTLFRRGQEIARKSGLILADTKYEFGMYEGKIYLIDEIHTPDSARYFDADGFEERQAQGKPQKQRSKEMVRQWLIQNNFQGRAGEKVPTMYKSWIDKISQEYIALYEQLTGKKFVKLESSTRLNDLQKNIENYLISRD
ncbi:MAG: phosphoribosylaminoimidazolesuccinocarboxamide synthase [Microscillaceae bacterium]|jgi:phosphoribosylaminoimidazole-succinocarboxamide synthase|nr:phosphoribosylaminoimidazolesuccinocarboxamide synthase [Microscillaceae bacterium]